MVLKNLLEKISYQCLGGSVELPVSKLIYDSREAEAGGIFVCIRGAKSDGHAHAKEAAEKGVAAIIAEQAVEVPEGVAVIQVENTREALAVMSAAYFGHPAEELKTIGITGTKGKTTSAYMVKSILENAGIKTGLIGTIETIIGERCIPAHNTTPESFVVQKTFREMADAGCQCVVMEVSSQGLMLHRVGGFVFDYGIFTNLERDHIAPNEHKDMEDYIHCKSMLFRQCRQGIINIDDCHAEQILRNHTCRVETFGFSEKAELRAVDAVLYQKPGCLGVRYGVRGLLDMDVEMNVPGIFSVYNALTAIAICRHFGVSEENIRKALEHVSVKGRVELVRASEQYTLIIDYAHNEMSLKSLLATIRDYAPRRLVCLFGCGGNRSRERRFEMGRVSSELSDLTVVTSDNPRDEEPADIIADIVTGLEKGAGAYVVIPDRKEAIQYCICHAQEGDVIVLAGKGHEDYQEIKGVKYKMDDRDLIREILEEE